MGGEGANLPPSLVPNILTTKLINRLSKSVTKQNIEICNMILFEASVDYRHIIVPLSTVVVGRYRLEGVFGDERLVVPLPPPR